MTSTTTVVTAERPIVNVIGKERKKPVAEEEHFEEEDDGVNDLPPFDPRLSLPRYKFPALALLLDYRNAGTTTNEEVNANREIILKTLADHKITIKQISATVGANGNPLRSGSRQGGEDPPDQVA
jgi:hypothetical protein